MAVAPDTSYVQTIASLSSSVTNTTRLPSGDLRGCSMLPAGTVRDSTAPLRSMSASCRPPESVETGPGTYARDPLAATLNCDVPVACVGARLTPSTTGTGPPDT